jgi:hypothetical protein
MTMQTISRFPQTSSTHPNKEHTKKALNYDKLSFTSNMVILCPE